MTFTTQKHSLRLDTKKYTLDDIRKEIQEDIDILISLGCEDLRNKTFEVDYLSAARTYGYCRRKLANHYCISINESYLRNCTKPEDIHNTIMHECIHMVDGCMNHKQKWKAIAARVNNKFQFTPIQRTGAMEEGYKAVVEQKYKYFAKCNRCGKVSKFMRKGSNWKYYSMGFMNCGTCGCSSFTCTEKH